MAASIAKKEVTPRSSWLRDLARSRAFRMIALGANIVAPATVVLILYFNTASLVQVREEFEDVQVQMSRIAGQLAAVREEKKNAEESKAKIEGEIAQLKLEKARVVRENQQLLAEADPKTVIARARRELGGETPRIRSDSLYKQGRDAYAAGNLVLAYELYLAARDEDPTYVWPHVGLGNVSVDRGDFRVAEKQFLRALQADPREPAAAFNLASINAHLRRWDKAEEYAQMTLTLDANHDRARRILREISEGRRVDN